MRGTRLQSVKETTHFLVQQMSAQDRLSIVTFASEVSPESLTQSLQQYSL